ncbi:MAG: UDP-N-acetylmuramate dehydrogenase, partial [Opitutales bacterium]
GLTTFGPGGDFDALPKESSQGLRVILRNQNETKEETVRAIGEFNGWNAIAALATCRFAFQKEVRGRLSSFPGLLRRQVVLKETAQRIIMEDYAHHPVELTVMLRRFRDRWSDREIKVVFQPHRFSRQASLQNAFAEALSSADQVHLLPTYGAGEELIKEGSAEVLRELLPVTIRDSKVQNSFSELCEAIGSDSSRPDCVLFLGAGDIELHASAFSHLEDVQWNRWLACENYLRERLSTAAEFRLNESLSDKTTLRVGGQAKIYCEPAGADDLRELIIAGRMFSMPLFALGRGSNLIVPTEGYDGIVLSMRASAWRGIEVAPKGRLVVGAGTRLKEICLFACNQSLAGFEFLEGIPGTLGGALRMNAGAMGASMFDLVEKITLMTAKGIRREMYRDEFDARYRECPELENSFVINATLMAAAKATKVHIENRLRSFAETRMASQPRGATAGCIFRNPRGDSAGRLIDQTGLKGARVGAAEVSLTHGNFIVNRGGAKTEDVLSLIRMVRHRVKEARGIELEPEVTLMGKSWKETFKTNL